MIFCVASITLYMHLPQVLIRDYLRMVVEDSFVGLFNAHQSIDIYHQGIMIYVHRV